MSRLPDLQNEILLFDGAMGTMIQKTGVLKPGHAPELLNIEHPEVISAIHQSYIQAGSKCIETNTFGGNRLKLEAHQIGERIRELNFAGVKLAKEITKTKPGCFVAASLGPTGRMMEPLGDLSFDEALKVFREQCIVFAEAGADLIAIETMSDLLEVKAAILAALEVNLPVVATVSLMENGHLLTGQTPEMIGTVLSGFPLYAVGTNCGLSASYLQPMVQKLLTYSQKPVMVQPNAGKPILSGNETVYQESAEEFARSCFELVQCGARIIGGCCGTTPEHIGLLRQLLDFQNIPNHKAAMVENLVGKSSISPVATMQHADSIWKFKLDPKNQIWNELCQGNSDSLIDQLLDLDSETWKFIELDGETLSTNDSAYFKELTHSLAAYWPNPIIARLGDSSLIQALLRHHPGRSQIISSRENADLISKNGGFFQESK